jgi:hypothetical protein
MHAWEWVRDVIDRLGYDGMSSEDSDREQETSDIKTYRVRRVPWRRDLTNIVELLERERRVDKSVFEPQGSQPVPRTRDPQAPASTRIPVHGLPLAFYDRQWYDSLTREQREELEVSEEDFGWYAFAVAR